MRKKLLRLLSLLVTGAAAIVWTVNCMILAVYMSVHKYGMRNNFS